MREFLELLPPSQALETFFQFLPESTKKGEWVNTMDSLGRVTCDRILSPGDLPSFDRSTVDGYAAIAKDTFGASDSLPAYLKVTGEILMGTEPGLKLHTGETALIHTGGMLPANADAVVMVENTQISIENEVEILRSVAPGENVILAGEDVKVGDEILPAGLRLRPVDIGGLIALGILKVKVVKPPVVGIISSGDEVVPPEQIPLPGKVRDVNSYTLSSLVKIHGAVPALYGIIPDQVQQLKLALSNALEECDLVVITAGSSASIRDLTADVMDQFGPPGVLVHGVNVRPGKPTILAICRGKPVIGLPGNPVSALVIADLFVSPWIHYFLGTGDKPWRAGIMAVLASNLPSQTGREDWIPVKLKMEKDQIMALPIFFKSNLIFNLSKADGLIRVEPDANGISAGEIVQVYPI